MRPVAAMLVHAVSLVRRVHNEGVECNTTKWSPWSLRHHDDAVGLERACALADGLHGRAHARDLGVVLGVGQRQELRGVRHGGHAHDAR